MPRSQRDSKIDTRTARLKLTPRRDPYWRVMETGRAVGYRRLKGGKPGRWIARLALDGDHKAPYKFSSLANADDYASANGDDILTFGQAQDAARAWFQGIAQTGGKVVQPLTVKEAADKYMEGYESRSGRATAKSRIILDAHILPTFGSRRLTELTTAEITNWRNRLVQQPAQRRKAKDGKPPRSDNAKAAAILAEKRAPTDPGEALRKRQASVNRVFTLLKAILNEAYKTGAVESDHAWRRVPPFKEADQARVRYLTDDESKRLVIACEPDFQNLVVAALLTGADYGELRTARVRDLDIGGRTLTVSKKRGLHTLTLTTEAADHFAAMTKAKHQDDLLLTRVGGDPWNDSHQVRRIAAACRAAHISPPINFHVLRHTFATRALRNGAQMHYVSHQLGHKNTRTTQRHYAHVIPSDAAQAIQQSMGDLSFAGLKADKARWSDDNRHPAPIPSESSPGSAAASQDAA